MEACEVVPPSAFTLGHNGHTEPDKGQLRLQANASSALVIIGIQTDTL